MLDPSIEQLTSDLKDYADAMRILGKCRTELVYAPPLWLKLDHADTYLRRQVEKLCAPFLSEQVSSPASPSAEMEVADAH